MSENLLRMRMFNIFFASVIAFGVVYNTARIALSESGRELATLRVLGFTRAEISWVLLGEVGLLTLAGVLPGLMLGRGLAALAVVALETRTQRFPLVIDPSTYGFAVCVVLIASIVSALVVRRRLDHLNLVEVLKSRE
jgi:putative ABC transport system permease protein